MGMQLINQVACNPTVMQAGNWRRAANRNKTKKNTNHISTFTKGIKAITDYKGSLSSSLMTPLLPWVPLLDDQNMAAAAVLLSGHFRSSMVLFMFLARLFIVHEHQKQECPCIRLPDIITVQKLCNNNVCNKQNSVYDIRFFGVYITKELTWSINSSHLGKKTQQRLFFLCKIKQARIRTQHHRKQHHIRYLSVGC